MRISTLIAPGLIALTLTGTAMAAGPDGKRGGYDRTAPTARADVIAMANQRFDRIDINQDGMIDAAEMAAHREQMKERMKERRAKRIAAREAASDAASDAASEASTDEGAKTSWRTRKGKRGGGWAGKQRGERGDWFARLDTDGDGMISRDEFIAPALKRFDRADADGDGIVTPEERAAAREARRAKRS